MHVFTRWIEHPLDVRWSNRAYLAVPESGNVKVFGCRPVTDGAAHSGGRRTKASNGGNRGKGYEGRAAGLWGFVRGVRTEG